MNASTAASHVRSTRPALAEALEPRRLLSDGAPDLTFGIAGQLETHFGDGQDRIGPPIIQADGKILLPVAVNRPDGLVSVGVARFNADGSPDFSFGFNGRARVVLNAAPVPATAGFSAALEPNGDILAGVAEGANFAVARFTPSGGFDFSFGSGGTALVPVPAGNVLSRLAVEPDGSILAAGGHGPIQGATGGVIVRLHPNGTLDTTFGTSGVASAFAQVLGLAINPQGDIFACGNQGLLEKYLPSGALDSSFSQSPAIGDIDPLAYSDIAVEGTDTVVVAGSGQDTALTGGPLSPIIITARPIFVARFTPTGADVSFHSGSAAEVDVGGPQAPTPIATSLVVQPDGKIIASGFGTTDSGSLESILFRVNNDGTTDASFGTGGQIDLPGIKMLGLALDAQSRIVTAAKDGPSVLLGRRTNTAAAPANPLPSGVLTLEGTAGNDVIDVAPGGIFLDATLNGVRIAHVPFSDVQHIVVFAGGGNDSVTVERGIDLPAEIHGESGDDTLVGGDANDTLLGGSGNDHLVGAGGANTEIGAHGNDTLFSATATDNLLETRTPLPSFGNDSMVGGSGDDRYQFDPSNLPAPVTDTVVELPNEGSDTIAMSGASDNPIEAEVSINLTSDSPIATAGNNLTVKTGAAGEAANFEGAIGDQGLSTLVGNAADNVLNDGGGMASMVGGQGNDRYVIRSNPGLAQTDVIDELPGEGIDVLDCSLLRGGVSVNLNSDDALAVSTFFQGVKTVKTAAPGEAANIENVIGSPFNDTIFGNAAANSLLGGAGNDSIGGGPGNDTLHGGNGNDTLIGGAGDDMLTGGPGLDSIVGGLGNNTFFAVDGQPDTLTGGTGNNTAHVDPGLDQIPHGDIQTVLNR